jgi:hypothetical protein
MTTGRGPGSATVSRAPIDSARSRARARPIPFAAPECPGEHGRVEPAALVADVDRHPATGRAGRDGDRAGAVLEGVAHQHVEHLVEHGRGRCRGRQARLDQQVEGAPAALGQLAPAAGAGGDHDRTDVDRLDRGERVPRPGQHLGDGGLDPLGPLQRLPDGGVPVRVRAEQHPLQAEAQRGERGPDLVRGVGGGPAGLVE